MTIEEILAGLARECRTALRLAKRYAELDRQHDDAFNDERTPKTSRRIDGIEEALLDTHREYRDALLRAHGLMSAFDARLRALAIDEEGEA